MPDQSLVMDASPLPLAPFSPDDHSEDIGADEFGRKRDSAIGLDRIVHGRSRAMAGRGGRRGGEREGASLFDMSLEASFAGSEGVGGISTAGDDEDAEEDGVDGQGWTLRLRRDDEAHLDDL